jgi:RHS repeat-associated protein
MISATKASVTTTYALNALGQRVKKTTSGSSRYFVYDEAGHLVGEYDNAGSLIQETVWLNDTPVATLRPNAGGVSHFYVHTDHLNAPRRVSRPSDNVVVWRWDSDPFGTTAAGEDPDGDSNLFSYNLRFPGQYLDAETGLHYNYLRDGYDAETGRYMQSDPIGLDGGLNTYAYVMSNPLLYSDPLGLHVNVCFYADAAAGFGHVGFGVDKEPGTQGFYPTGNPFGSPGKVKPDAQKEKQCKVIESPPEKDQCMLKCRTRRIENPGQYRLTGRQCTSYVRECLKECGLPYGTYSGPRPNPFYRSLPGKKQ